MTAEFVETYGWDPTASAHNTTDDLATVIYEDTASERTTLPGESALTVPEIGGGAAVEVLATAVCGDPADQTACTGVADQATEVLWAIRSANLTYVGELPFDYMTESSRYLAFADLYYDVLAPDTPPVRRAAVRLEDVGPESDPADLRRVADYLHEEGVPFQVAVIPVHVAKVPDSDPTRWLAVSLLDRTAVVDALRYLQQRGGTLAQHGTTHQYGFVGQPVQRSVGCRLRVLPGQVRRHPGTALRLRALPSGVVGPADRAGAAGPGC